MEMMADLEKQVKDSLGKAQIERTIEHVIERYLDHKVTSLVHEFVAHLSCELAKKANLNGVVSDEVKKVARHKVEEAARSDITWRVHDALSKEVEKQMPGAVSKALEEMDLEKGMESLKETVKQRAKDYLAGQVSELIRAELGVISKQLNQVMMLESRLNGLSGEVASLQALLQALRR